MGGTANVHLSVGAVLLAFLKTIPSGVFNFSVVGALAWMPGRISQAANKER
jgi:hypothetical protein